MAYGFEDMVHEYAEEIGLKDYTLPTGNYCNNIECDNCAGEIKAELDAQVVRLPKVEDNTRLFHDGQKITTTQHPYGGWAATDEDYAWTPDGGHERPIGSGDTEQEAIDDYKFQVEEEKDELRRN